MKCDTIFYAAHRAGLTTAAFRRPVTAGGKFNFSSEIYRYSFVFAIPAFWGNGLCSTMQKVQPVKFSGLCRNEFMIIALGILALYSEKNKIIFNLKKGVIWYAVCRLANGGANFLMIVLAMKMPAIVL